MAYNNGIDGKSLLDEISKVIDAAAGQYREAGEDAGEAYIEGVIDGIKKHSKEAKSEIAKIYEDFNKTTNNFKSRKSVTQAEWTRILGLSKELMKSERYADRVREKLSDISVTLKNGTKVSGLEKVLEEWTKVGGLVESVQWAEAGKNYRKKPSTKKPKVETPVVQADPAPIVKAEEKKQEAINDTTAAIVKQGEAIEQVTKKTINMAHAIRRYNKLMEDLGDDDSTTDRYYDSSNEDAAKKWTLKDMVNRARMHLDTYNQEGHANHDLKNESDLGRKMWESETKKLQRFINRYEPYVDLVQTTVGDVQQSTTMTEKQTEALQKQESAIENAVQAQEKLNQTQEKASKKTTVKVEKPELLQNIDVLEDREEMYDAKTVAQKRKTAEEMLRAQWKLYQDMKKEYDGEDTSHLFGVDYDNLLMQQGRLEAYIALYEKYGGSIEKVGKKLKAFSDDNGFTGSYQYNLNKYEDALRLSEEQAQALREQEAATESAAKTAVEQNKITISSYQDLYAALEKVVNLSKQLKPEYTAEYGGMYEMAYKAGYPDSKESLIASIKAQYDNVQRIKASIKNGLSVYKDIDGDGYEATYSIDDNTLKNAENMLHGYIYQAVEYFGYSVADAMNDFDKKRIRTFVEKEINKYLEVSSKNDEYRMDAEAFNAPIRDIIESITDTIMNMATDAKSNERVFDSLAELKSRSEDVNRYTLSTQANHIGSNIGLSTPYSEVHENAKKIETYEELCELVTRYNELQKRNAIFGGTEHAGLDESEEMELRRLRARLEATGGKDIYKLSDFGRFDNVDKLADAMGIADQKAEKAQKEIEAVRLEAEQFVARCKEIQNQEVFDGIDCDKLISELSTVLSKLKEIAEQRDITFGAYDPEWEFESAKSQLEYQKRVAEAAKEGIVYHAGVLGNVSHTMKSRPLGSVVPAKQGDYNSLTGLYTTPDWDGFIGNEWSGAPISTIDINQYKLFDARRKSIALQAHQFFDNLNGTIYGYQEYFDNEAQEMAKTTDVKSIESLYEEFKSVFVNAEMSFEQFAAFIKESAAIVKGHDFKPIDYVDIDEGIGKSYSTSALQGVSKKIFDSDSFSTRLMKMLGYEGLDTRGSGLDSTYKGGTVIFDVKPESIISADGKWSELMSRHGVEIDEKSLENEKKRRQLAFETAKAYSQQADATEKVANTIDKISATEKEMSDSKSGSDLLNDIMGSQQEEWEKRLEREREERLQAQKEAEEANARADMMTMQREGKAKGQAYAGDVYHGSGEQLNDVTFDPKIGNGLRRFGLGAYFATELDEAAQFGDNIVKKSVYLKNVFMLTKDMVSDLDDLYVAMGKVKPENVDYKTAMDDLSSYLLDMNNIEPFTNRMKKIGYDGMFAQDGKSKELVVYDEKYWQNWTTHAVDAVKKQNDELKDTFDIIQQGESVTVKFETTANTVHEALRKMREALPEDKQAWGAYIDNMLKTGSDKSIDTFQSIRGSMGGHSEMYKMENLGDGRVAVTFSGIREEIENTTDVVEKSKKSLHDVLELINKMSAESGDMDAFDKRHKDLIDKVNDLTSGADYDQMYDQLIADENKYQQMLKERQAQGDAYIEAALNLIADGYGSVAPEDFEKLYLGFYNQIIEGSLSAADAMDQLYLSMEALRKQSEAMPDIVANMNDPRVANAFKGMDIKKWINGNVKPDARYQLESELYKLAQTIADGNSNAYEMQLSHIADFIVDNYRAREKKEANAYEEVFKELVVVFDDEDVAAMGPQLFEKAKAILGKRLQKRTEKNKNFDAIDQLVSSLASSYPGLFSDPDGNESQYNKLEELLDHYDVWKKDSKRKTVDVTLNDADKQYIMDDFNANMMPKMYQNMVDSASRLEDEQLAFDGVAQSANNAAKAKEKFDKANKKVKDGAEQSADSLDDEAESFNDVNRAAANMPDVSAYDSVSVRVGPNGRPYSISGTATTEMVDGSHVRTTDQYSFNEDNNRWDYDWSVQSTERTREMVQALEEYYKILNKVQKLRLDTSGKIHTEEINKLETEDLARAYQRVCDLGIQVNDIEGQINLSVNQRQALLDVELRARQEMYDVIAKMEDKQATTSAKPYQKTVRDELKKSADIDTNVRLLGDDGVGDRLRNQIADYRRLVDELVDMRLQLARNFDFANDIDFSNRFADTAKRAKNARVEIEGIFKESQKLDQISKNTLIDTHILNPSELQNLKAAMISFAASVKDGEFQFKGFNKSGTEMYGTLKQSSGAIKDVTVALKSSSDELYMYGTNASKASDEWNNFSTALANGAKNLVGMYVGFQEGVQAFRTGLNYVKEIDLAMTELKKVTDETDASYKQFLNDAGSTSAIIGSTISDFTEASATFARLGYSMEEASSMAETAIIYKNVADGLDSVEESSDSIISTMMAFGIEANDTMSIIDRFNAVGNNFAITSAGIGEALQRSASALYSAGNTIDESVALVTAANSVIQNPEQVGKMLADYKVA